MKLSEPVMLHLMYARLYLKNNRDTVNVLKGTRVAKVGTLRVPTVERLLTH